MRQPGKVTVWPANIDSTKTTGQGRKVKKSLSVHSPRLHEMQTAASNLGLKFEIVKGSSRPDSWWEKTGHMILERSGMSKRELLLALVAEIRRLRNGRSYQ
ncbi:signal recognition particle protein Srp19 [Candidatus Bathyarchaeota archaeon]|nr:signal recognition particle protein Srp19 [Candidatus Bathyarchaeota archaeon]